MKVSNEELFLGQVEYINFMDSVQKLEFEDEP